MREIDRLIDCMSVYTHRASFDIERHYIVHCFQCTQLQPVWLELSTTSSRSIIIATTDVQCRHQPSILRLESAADSRLPMHQLCCTILVIGQYPSNVPVDHKCIRTSCHHASFCPTRTDANAPWPECVCYAFDNGHHHVVVIACITVTCDIGIIVGIQ
jgi:hypothetical protein